ncbi:MAG: cytochrome C [Deltaproteobacteria bacterium]|nr:MAG: cytochrome C [Deltaproteobacteria bacterium]
MSALFVALAVAATPSPSSRMQPPGHIAAETRCEACHSSAGWRPVAFDHSRTGFPLEGRHVFASCRACHGSSTDFRAPVPTSCGACHQDVHTGEFGNRCASCHDPSSWATQFGPDAHRNTNFPLTGRHAAIPCEECHQNQRDRRFTRAAADCFACHQTDYARTAGTSLDHARAGFGIDCKSCHFPTRFKGARFAGHDACFQLSAGPHAGIGCLDCHTTLTSFATPGTCSTNTADCMRCHACSHETQTHARVAGFQCSNRKCYECHTFTAATGLRPPAGRVNR